MGHFFCIGTTDGHHPVSHPDTSLSCLPGRGQLKEEKNPWDRKQREVRVCLGMCSFPLISLEKYSSEIGGVHHMQEKMFYEKHKESQQALKSNERKPVTSLELLFPEACALEKQQRATMDVKKPQRIPLKTISSPNESEIAGIENDGEGFGALEEAEAVQQSQAEPVANYGKFVTELMSASARKLTS
ncbi:hypothetical protein FQN60_010438 [Etheostoma spectabile]|uniref:Uncharacterized protein n=1 Tax=Etheostoma spectabile TaxID=54343 RepID=A0A5J5D7T6_9PERO|nr:hypothetical protein FQN60_010438 [Etheostoma spectabile]